jgi:hypothetical protein
MRVGKSDAGGSDFPVVLGDLISKVYGHLYVQIHI